MLKDIKAGLLEAHGGTLFLSDRVETQEITNPAMFFKLNFVESTTPWNGSLHQTPAAAEDQRSFLSTQPVHQDSNIPHQGFHHCLKGLL